MPEITNSAAVDIISKSWKDIRKAVDDLEKGVLEAYQSALELYDGDLVGQEADLPLSSVFRPSNRLGEGVFACEDNWLKSIIHPTSVGAMLKLFVN